MIIEFFVPGVPQPGGSKRGFAFQSKDTTGKPRTHVRIVEDAKRSAPWRADVRAAAERVYQAPPIEGRPIRMDVIFLMPRPQYHRRANGELKPDAPAYHITKPDRTKLLRALEDALTGILWKDDTLVAAGVVEKRYAHDARTGAHVHVVAL